MHPEHIYETLAAVREQAVNDMITGLIYDLEFEDEFENMMLMLQDHDQGGRK